MFKIFLTKKLFSGSDTSDGKRVTRRNSTQRNKRIFQRYQVTPNSLTILNEQDILMVRDISSKGFRSDVSDRAFDRFNIGDLYNAKLRYGTEIYPLKIRVAWKRNKVVGFEFIEPTKEMILLLRRLLRPMELADSLKRVDADFIAGGPAGKTWYHGDYGTELFTWEKEGEIEAWQLYLGNEYIEWNAAGGVTTGTLKKQEEVGKMAGFSSGDLIQSSDPRPNPKTTQFAMDLVHALDKDLRERLLPTLNEVRHGT